MPERLAYSPAEFAALFGKDQSWAYRKIKSNQLKAVSSFGNMMVPASEADRILNQAEYGATPVKMPGKRGRGRPRKKLNESPLTRYLKQRRKPTIGGTPQKVITAYSLKKKQVFGSSNTTRAEILNKLNKRENGSQSN